MLYTCNNMGRSQNNYTEFKKKKTGKKSTNIMMQLM